VTEGGKLLIERRFDAPEKECSVISVIVDCSEKEMDVILDKRNTSVPIVLIEGGNDIDVSDEHK
jgi:hypothetical protein